MLSDQKAQSPTVVRRKQNKKKEFETKVEISPDKYSRQLTQQITTPEDQESLKKSDDFDD